MMKFGIIGFPLGHSRSPQYFNEKFKQENINAEYLAFEIKDIREISRILSDYPGLKGFNVTIPHKQNIIPYLTEISEEARQIGAVNCVKTDFRNGEWKLTGYNTDMFGFKKSLLQFIPPDINKALILGNGGAAKAVRYALKSLGMEILTASRNPRNADEISYTDIYKYISSYLLIINTTPLGTWPDTEECPDIPYEILTSGHYLYDLIYNPEQTEFMKRGIAKGAHTLNGYEMWLGQAEKSWQIWNGDID